MDSKKTCSNEIGLCALNIENHYRFNNEHNMEGPCDSFKRKNTNHFDLL